MAWWCCKNGGDDDDIMLFMFAILGLLIRGDISVYDHIEQVLTKSQSLLLENVLTLNNGLINELQFINNLDHL